MKTIITVQNMGYIAIALVLFGFAFVLWKIYSFAKADADLTILSKAPIPPNAFKDKVVWITGASQGIGEALAKEFATHGAKLILSARRLPELERVQATLSGLNAPDPVVLLPLDVTSGEEIISEAVEKAEAVFSGNGVDIMVHGASAPRPYLEYSKVLEDITKTSFAVNVIGLIILTRILAPKMVERGHGQFAVLSSVAGKIPVPGKSVYAATKSAVNAYFESVRSEIGYTGVKVSLICPGPVMTDEISTEARQPLPRVIELIMRSIYYEIEETWIAQQPTLSFIYLKQHFPLIASFILQKLGPKRIKKGNTYKLRMMLEKDE